MNAILVTIFLCVLVAIGIVVRFYLTPAPTVLKFAEGLTPGFILVVVVWALLLLGYAIGAGVQWINK